MNRKNKKKIFTPGSKQIVPNISNKNGIMRSVNARRQGQEFMSRGFILKAQLTSAVFLLVIALISGFFIFGPELTRIAKALSGDYDRANSGDNNLDAADWDLLDEDFVAKSGDTMTGPLSLPGDPSSSFQAATKQYVDYKIKDSAGRNLRIFCGSSPTGIWLDHGPNSVQAVVDTSDAGFSNDNVKYIVYLSGSNAGVAVGLDTLYDITATSFELHVTYLGWNVTVPGITGDQANSWGWRVHWCGIGE